MKRALLATVWMAATLGGCAHQGDTRDAFPPPEVVRAEVFQIHAEIDLGEGQPGMKAWVGPDGAVVVGLRSEVLRFTPEGQLESRASLPVPIGASPIDAGKSIRATPGLVLAWEGEARRGAATTAGWATVSPDGRQVASGIIPSLRIPLLEGAVAGTWQAGRAVVAWIERPGEIVCHEPETGRSVRLALPTGQRFSFLWGWVADRADGRMVLVAELRKEPFTVNERPTLWVLEPDFAAGQIRKTVTEVERPIRTLFSSPGYLVYVPEAPAEVLLAGPWWWPEGIEYFMRVIDRRVSLRSVSRAVRVPPVGPLLLGTTPGGELATVRVESFVPGLEPGKPPKYQGGPTIVVRSGERVVARSAVLEGGFADLGCPNPVDDVDR